MRYPGFILSIVLAIFFSSISNAQMSDGKYGNEWIVFDQSYYKIGVAEDGIYRITQQQLLSVGIPANAVRGDQFQLWHMGEEVPIYTSTTGSLGGNDYIEFFGQKNRSQLDEQLFADPANEMLNPNYSLFTDTATYFLTWHNSTSSTRYTATNNSLSNLPGKEPHFMHDAQLLFTEAENGGNGHVKRTINSDGGAFSYFDVAEGFSSGFANSQSATIDVPHLVSNGTQSHLHVRFASDNGAHETAVRLNNTQLISETYSGYQVRDYNFNVNTADISNGADITVEALSGNTDRVALAEVTLSYPRAFNFDNQKQFIFQIEQSGGVRYLEIENFDASGIDPVLYDVTNNIRIVAKLDGNLIKLALPASNIDRTLVLTGNQGAINSGALIKANFVDYSQQDAQFIIITHQSLLDNGQGQNYVQQYANYRNTPQGGGYTTSIVEIQQLYDQFAYGINRHPLSIRNFGHYIDQNWSDPQYIFLIGKGRTYDEVRRNSDLTNPNNLPLLVPTFGKPGSDAFLTGDGQVPTPRIPIGRIAANTAREVDLYLRKVKDFEANANLPQTIEDREWMKQIIHLGGGGPSEQAFIRSYLEQMAIEIESNRFGGKVSGFYKTSSDPVQISTSEQIFTRINKGVSIITFFGHSGVNAFDFNIDNPDNYENQGKYPIMFSLGCFIGNIHTSFQGISERFTFNEDKGAIGFGASTSLGFPSALRSFTLNFYKLLGGELYGNSLGNIHQENLKQLASNSPGLKELLQQFTLHCDPALRLNPHPGPDYVVDPTTVDFEPSVVTAQLDSFDIRFDVVNLGQGIEDSIVLKIEQEFPNGTSVVPSIYKIKAPNYISKQHISIPTYGRSSVGLNKLYITVDSENDVDELPFLEAEANNELVNGLGQKGFDFFITDNGAQPIFPRKFAIANSPDVTLTSITLDPLAVSQAYIYELDTTAEFNSGNKIRHILNQKGGLIKWQPNYTWLENQVYYWRISPDSSGTGVGYQWESSSFIYLPNSGDGWNQSHFFQFDENEFENMQLDTISRDLKFASDFKDIRLVNKVWNPVEPPRFENNGKKWGSPFLWTINEGIQIIVRSPNTLQYWVNEPGADNYNSINNGLRMVAYPYKTNTQDQRKDLLNFLDNVIPDDHYVILYTVQRSNTADYSPSLWDQDTTQLSKSIYSVLEEQGATKIKELRTRGAVPYVLIYQKGKGVLNERIGQDINDVLFVDQSFQGFWNEGFQYSTLIGPSTKWEQLHYSISAFDVTEDTVGIDIYGVNQALGIDTLLYADITESPFDLSQIDESIYPKLRLNYYAKDDIGKTAANLDYWRVNFIGLPDVAVNPNKLFEVNKDTIQQGDIFELSVGIENTNSYLIDSLDVRYTYTDKSNKSFEFIEHTPKLEQGEEFPLTLQFNTKEVIGKINLAIDVNYNKEVAEEFYFNNYLGTTFFVKGDRKNPLLDVTFDGLHIIDNDIVSPSPNILITLKDENPFLRLSDTSLFRVFLDFPDGSTKKINFSDPSIAFMPASNAQENSSTIEFIPMLTEDGTYRLIVQAEDASGNQSGDLDYKVQFQVINKKSLSNILNYPNPFSTATQFVYTLTGDIAPAFFKIQILTVSGRIVKEITQDEIGPLRIGTHKTDYSWDGTDDYGNRLANGVYLYRIIAKGQDGKDFERRSNSTDRFFRKNFGKMVILR